MTILVMFEQLSIFYLCLNSFLLSHNSMRILVVFEQFSIFLTMFEQLFIELCLNGNLSCVSIF